MRGKERVPARESLLARHGAQCVVTSSHERHLITFIICCWALGPPYTQREEITQEYECQEVGIIRHHLRGLCITIYINPIEDYTKNINKYFTTKANTSDL